SGAVSIRSISLTASPPFDTERARSADTVLEQFEGDAVADGEGIERRAVLHVAPMEKHLATAGQPDEAVSLADKQCDDSTRTRRAAAWLESARRVLASRRCRWDSASKRLAHSV